MSSRLRVVVDARWIRSLQLDGIGRYTSELLTALWQLPEASEAEWVVLGHDPEVLDLLAERAAQVAFVPLQVDFPVLSPREIWGLKGVVNPLLEADRRTVFWVPNYLLLARGIQLPLVLTVHDLIPYLLPEVRDNWRWKLFYAWPGLQRGVLNQAQDIVCVSAHTRQDVIDHFGLESQRLSVVPEGVSPRFAEPVEPRVEQALREKFGLRGEFILSVARQQPYKNLVGLVRAYRALPESLRQRFQLVLVGPEHHLHAADVQSLVAEEETTGRIVATGYVSDEALRGLYQSAGLFVMPSFYEGFGLPVLEAMAAGAPVACSRVASLPEVGGEAAAYFDPHDQNDFNNTLESLLNDEARRAEMKAQGRARAAEFSWHKVAEAMWTRLKASAAKAST